MHTDVWSAAITAKIQELCQTVLSDDWYKSLQTRREAFEQDTSAQSCVEAVQRKGQELRYKQSQGQEITQAEIEEFERLREEFFSHPIARAFYESQEEMNEIKSTVAQHVAATLELGRLPSPEDLHGGGGGCGSGGCGCKH